MLKSYDEGIEVHWHLTSSSVCSMMSEIATNEEELSFLKLNDNNLYRKQAVISDLENKIIEKVSQYPCDYLIIDFLEERHPLMCIEKNKIITYSDMFEEFCDKERISNQRCIDMLEIPFECWVESCDKYIELLRKCYKPKQIILNRLYLAECYGMQEKEKEFLNIEYIRLVNDRLDKMYDYFEMAFRGVQSICLPDNETNYCFANFTYGCDPVYYNRDRYLEIRNKIIDVLENDSENNY